MAYTGIESIKEAYVNQLIKDDEFEHAFNIQNKDYITPIFTGGDIHPESVPNVNNMNKFLTDICVDCAALKKEIQSVAGQYNILINNIKSRLSAVDDVLRREEEQMKDINIICGNYKDFATVKTLRVEDLGGTFGYRDNYTISLYGQTYQVAVSIADVTGNGYEGNKYVVDENKNFIQDSLDTGKRQYMIDDSIVTAYEYSRLTISSNETDYPTDANFDNEEAVCSIIIKADQKFSALNISSDIDTVILKDILISSDNGATYNSAQTKKDIAINSIDEKYSNAEYVYGSGVISFEASNYVKIILQSSDTTSEKLMYQKAVIDAYTDLISYNNYELTTAKRHLIRVNNIEILKGNYNTQAVIYTENLIDSPVKSIAVFASEYIPSFFNSDTQYFKYVLTVNGIDYEIVPINSDRNGIKMIRFLDIVSTDSYIKHIDESIKAAKLTITMQTTDGNYTPYISNLKICLGDIA